MKIIVVTENKGLLIPADFIRVSDLTQLLDTIESVRPDLVLFISETNQPLVAESIHGNMVNNENCRPVNLALVHWTQETLGLMPCAFVALSKFNGQTNSKPMQYITDWPWPMPAHVFDRGIRFMIITEYALPRIAEFHAIPPNILVGTEEKITNAPRCIRRRPFDL